MIQLIFQQMANLFGHAKPKKLPRPRTEIDHTLRLATALRVYGLTHQVHDVLCAVAKLQAERGHATIPAVCLELSCTYQNVNQHLIKNPDWFLVDKDAQPRRYTLSPEAIRVMAKVQKRIRMQ